MQKSRGGNGALGVFLSSAVTTYTRFKIQPPSRKAKPCALSSPAKVYSGGAGQPAAADLTGSGDDLTSAPCGDLCDRALDSVSAHLLPAAHRDARVRQGSQLSVLLAAFLCVLLPFLSIKGVEKRQGKPACCSSYGQPLPARSCPAPNPGPALPRGQPGFRGGQTTRLGAIECFGIWLDGKT